MTFPEKDKNNTESSTTAPITAVEREALAVANDPVLKHMLDEERVDQGSVDSALLGRLVRYVKPHWRLAAVAVVLTTVQAVMLALPALVIGLAIDRVATQSPRVDGFIERWVTQWGDSFLTAFGAADASPEEVLLVFFGILLTTILVTRWILNVVTIYLVNKLGQLVVHDLRVEVYNHVTGLDQGFFHKNPVGRLVNRTTFDSQTLAELFSDAFAQIFQDLLFFVVLFAIMFGLDAPLATVLLLAMPVLVMAARLYRKYGRPALRTMQAVLSRMNAWLAENLSGMRENHLYRREDRRRAEFESLTMAHQTSMTRVLQAWALLRPAMLMISAVATAGVLLLGYARVLEGLITVGVLITFVQYTTQLWRPVRNLTEKYNLIQNALTAGERVVQLLDTSSAMVDGPSVDSEHQVEQGSIRFENVKFVYPGTVAVVLDGVDFEVEPGQSLALVGDTGAGKSTIAHLISRFYDPTGGRVLVDGRPTDAYTLRQLRSSIAIVPQDVVIFAGSLRDNITLGEPVDDETIWVALRAVKADRLMARFKHGLDHQLEEGGRTLSTGERQLLSFARALVANPPILVLDEATANVDSKTEAQIQLALAELTQGRTSVVIAHRLSTIRNADCILVLRNGQILERGRHETLLALGGEYARLHEAHVSGQTLVNSAESRSAELL